MPASLIPLEVIKIGSSALSASSAVIAFPVLNVKYQVMKDVSGAEC